MELQDEMEDERLQTKNLQGKLKQEEPQQALSEGTKESFLAKSQSCDVKRAVSSIETVPKLIF
jgi:hypothetical protein